MKPRDIDPMHYDAWKLKDPEWGSIDDYLDPGDEQEPQDDEEEDEACS